MATIFETEGDDYLKLERPGTATVDFLGGTDTLDMGTSVRSTFNIVRDADGTVFIDSKSGASGGGLHLTLYHLELVKFNDGSGTIDLRTYFGDSDTTPPTVTGFSPANHGSGVAVASPIVFTFSEAIQKGSGSIVLKTSSGAVVASYDVASSANLAVAGNTLTIKPGSELAWGTVYSVDVAAGSLKDLAGNAYAGISGSTGYSFTTQQNLLGTAGNDVLTAGLGHQVIDGLAGTDKLVFSQPRSAYTVAQTSTGYSVTAIDASGGYELSHVERLQFSDTKLALDISGPAGQTAKILGAVFGKDAIAAHPDYVGIGLQFLDGGTSYEALMQLALDARLGANASHKQVVDLLYTNVVNVAVVPPADEAYFVSLLDNHSYTPATLAVLAGDTDFNLHNIDLVGLAQTGLAYTGG